MHYTTCSSWDASFVDTLALFHILNTSKSSGSVAMLAVSSTNQKYRDFGPDHLFTQYGVQTLDPCSPNALSFKNSLSHKLTGLEDPRAGSYPAQWQLKGEQFLSPNFSLYFILHY